MPAKKNHWAKAATYQRKERYRVSRLEARSDPLAILKTRVVERTPPPRFELKDSCGQPISLPVVSILKRGALQQ